MRRRPRVWLLALALTASPSPCSAGPEQKPVGTAEAAAPYDLRDQAEIRQALDRVLSEPEFRRLRQRESEPPEAESSERILPEWLRRLLEWLARWLGSGAPSSEVKTSPAFILVGLRWALYLVAASALLAVIVMMVRAALGRSWAAARTSDTTSGAGEPSSCPPGELASQEYLRRALAFAESGNHKAAIRQILLGTMSWIERKGLVRYRKGLTNGDYLRAVHEHPRTRESLERIVLAFEQVYFGRRRATDERFRECLQSFRQTFQTE